MGTPMVQKDYIVRDEGASSRYIWGFAANLEEKR